MGAGQEAVSIAVTTQAGRKLCLQNAEPSELYLPIRPINVKLAKQKHTHSKSPPPRVSFTGFPRGLRTARNTSLWALLGFAKETSITALKRQACLRATKGLHVM